MNNELFPEIVTVKDAKKEVFDTLAKGIICPCCERFAKKYPRKIHSSIARCLLMLYKHTKANEINDEAVWVRANTFFPHTLGSDFEKLRYWGLIKKRRNEPQDNWLVAHHFSREIICKR